MSHSVPKQWISKYVMTVAETGGKSFTDMETLSHSQTKRVQILEFFTYKQDAGIWGKVSDEEYSISVCFTKDAVSQYVQNFHSRLTEAKRAICLIGQFRPIFVRIPAGNNRVRLSEEPHIALEVRVVNYVDSGLGVLGSPQDIEMNLQVEEWVRGLRSIHARSIGDHGSVRLLAEASPMPRALGLDCASPVIASALPLTYIERETCSNALTPRVDCQGPTSVGGTCRTESNAEKLTYKKKILQDAVVFADGSKFSTPPPMCMPQHHAQAGALRASESPIVAASRVDATPSAVQEVTALPPTQTTQSTPLYHIDVFPEPDVVNAEGVGAETADALDRMSDTQTRRGLSPTSFLPPASCKLGKIAVNEEISVVPNYRRNHSVKPDIKESCKDRVRINKSFSYKPRRKRLMGYQVDFENISLDGDNSGPIMNMKRLCSMLLQTGRIRTLGDQVTRDGMIFIKSD
ncbi:hypothetical protein EDD22DRAFT_959104 [Suillus occidentalis]|nr:hypothetical protein EDD22DRAFT_959104 [Suillus occidentalis]